MPNWLEERHRIEILQLKLFWDQIESSTIYQSPATSVEIQISYKNVAISNQLEERELLPIAPQNCRKTKKKRFLKFEEEGQEKI